MYIPKHIYSKPKEIAFSYCDHCDHQTVALWGLVINSHYLGDVCRCCFEDFNDHFSDPRPWNWAERRAGDGGDVVVWAQRDPWF